MCNLDLTDIYQPSCKGLVTMGYRSKSTNVFTPVLHKQNLVMYGAADAMARLVSGDMRYVVSHMYYHYINTSSSIPSISAITDRSQGSSFFQSMNSSDHSVIQDWLRIPIFTAAKLSAYGATPTLAENYTSNMSTFVATSASSATQAGESSENYYFADSGANGPSNIIGVALVCAPVNSDNSQDVVFSRLALSSPIVVQANSYIDCFWGLAFQ